MYYDPHLNEWRPFYITKFCPDCGTHLATRPQRPIVGVKVGTLDDPKQFGGPRIAIYTCDKQPFHVIPDGMPTFEKLPG